MRERFIEDSGIKRRKRRRILPKFNLKMKGVKK